MYVGKCHWQHIKWNMLEDLFAHFDALRNARCQCDVPKHLIMCLLYSGNHNIDLGQLSILCSLAENPNGVDAKQFALIESRTSEHRHGVPLAYARAEPHALNQGFQL